MKAKSRERLFAVLPAFLIPLYMVGLILLANYELVFFAFVVGFPTFLYLLYLASTIFRATPVKQFSIGIKSIVGGREVDEDSLAAVDVLASLGSSQGRKVMAVVADGMGGHNKGEVASRIAIREIISGLFSQLGDEALSAVEALKKSFTSAHREIIAYALDNPECEGMGTTASAVVTDGKYLNVGHVGDTRVYIVREKEIRQVTKDHSLVQEMVDRGEITPQQARRHPKRNVVTRALGAGEKIEVDTYSLPLPKNSYVLLCCDGLVTELEDEEIKDVVLSSPSCQEACEELIRRAELRRPKDNVSVIVMGPFEGASAEAKTVVKPKRL
ncbi:MAG: Stp1/IreP family PP2C-type Ser/Thr phosphatase [Candidatus Hadarchaeales archaeon]